MKLLITENQLKNVIILETIKAKEADDDLKSLKTIVNGKRGVGSVSLNKNDSQTPMYLKIIKNNNLHLINLPENRGGLHIVYADGYEDRAKELADIANSYGGYLSYNASVEDTRRIGELLDYDPQDVEDFIKNRK